MSRSPGAGRGNGGLHGARAVGLRHEARETLAGYGPTHLVIHGQARQLSAPSAPTVARVSVVCAARNAAMRLCSEPGG